MDTGDTSAPVTRREFYSALVLVWTFIMLAFSATMFTSRSPTPANVIYFLAALLMVINYTVASWRGDMPRKSVGIAALLAVLAVLVGVVAFFAGRVSN